MDSLTNVDQVIVTPLDRIHTIGGDVLHGIKSIDKGYHGFGEAYFSWIQAGHTKAWKCHKKMTMNVVVPVGMVRFVFKSLDFKESRIEEIGVDRYVRLTVPPNLWFGFKGLASPHSLVLNVSNIMHNPDEVNRLNLSEIQFPTE